MITLDVPTVIALIITIILTVEAIYKFFVFNSSKYSFQERVYAGIFCIIMLIFLNK